MTSFLVLAFNWKLPFFLAYNGILSEFNKKQIQDYFRLQKTESALCHTQPKLRFVKPENGNGVNLQIKWQIELCSMLNIKSKLFFLRISFF